MPIGIYPPTLRSTQDAFLATTTMYPVYFTLQSITSFNDIGHLQVRVIRQNDNTTIVNTALYPDAAIYFAPSQIKKQDNSYFINLSGNDLSEPWRVGQLYKIQMRFGTNPKYTSLDDFASWKQQQINLDAFSEWSNVMIIKAISAPTVQIKNAGGIREGVITSERTESTLTPLFSGYCAIAPESNELVDQYKFDLLKNGEVIETSGWKLHNSNVDSLDTHRFKTILSDTQEYTVTYEIVTENGYKAKAQDYDFTTSLTFLPDLSGITMTVESDTPYCKDNACINIYLNADNLISGDYVLTRTSEKTNFTIYEDLHYLVYSKKELNNERVYQDFTIESGIRYRYALQEENAAKLRSAPLTESPGVYHVVNFEYSYLYRDGVQLRLQFDNTMNSFKHTTLRSKQDTLGDRYPHLTANGHAYYAEFPVNGLISFNMDTDQTFFTRMPDGYYFNGELVIPDDKFDIHRVERDKDIPSGESLPIDNNLTDDNIFIERMFRSRVEDFLNGFDSKNQRTDFTYKLYKSPTEGNMVVGLMNVSLTPNQTLGRMIYSFTATAYEVADTSLLSLDKFGIIDIGEFTLLSSDELSLSFGQVGPIYENGSDIYQAITDQEEISIGGGYKMQLEYITALWVEQYPRIDLTGDILEQEALKSDAQMKGESTKPYDDKIAELKALKNVLDGPQMTTTILTINNTRILMQPNKIYKVREKVQSITLEAASAPILVNYVCDLTQQQDKSVGVISAIESSRIWGQISGIFTETDKILRSYNYQYRNSPTFRIYNSRPDLTVVYDKQGDVLVDNTTFNLYKSLNLLDIIKQETQKQVEFIYNTRFQEVDGQLTDGTIFYEFDHIQSFDIEADAGTVILIGHNKDGSDAQEVRIGTQDIRKIFKVDTGNMVAYTSHSTRFVLGPLEEKINYIALKSPQFCVINYSCITDQMILTKAEGGS